jgi:hypothetical protein
MLMKKISKDDCKLTCELGFKFVMCPDISSAAG